MFKVEITDKEILTCKHPKEAMRMSLDRSGRSLYAVATECGISESLLSRCLNVNDTPNLSHDRVLQFMVSCGNAIYMRWQYLTLKTLMPELDNDDGACIASEIEILKSTLVDAIAEIKAARHQHHCKECGAQFALEPDRVVVPRWLLAEALLIEREAGL